MSSTFQFQVILQGVSGLAEDVYVNNWHFMSQPTSPVDFDNVRDMLKDFYETAPAGSPLRTYYTTSALTNTVRVKAYDLDAPKPRAPSYESTWTANWGTGDPFPGEIALCVSFEAERESGELQSRRRNRVYLGPFKYSATHTGGRPSSTFQNDVLNAAKRLGDASAASVNWTWKIYSPTDNAVHNIYRIWVDNAWDSQRRRGLSPTTRVQYVAP